MISKWMIAQAVGCMMLSTTSYSQQLPSKRYFVFNFEINKGVYTQELITVVWAAPGVTEGRMEDGDKLLQLTLINGQIIEVPFRFSLEGRWNRETWKEDPNESYSPGVADLFVGTDQDAKSYRILNRSTKDVLLEKIFPNAGVKPVVSVTLGSKSELRVIPVKTPDRTIVLFSLNQGQAWFFNGGNEKWLVTENGTNYPMLPIQSTKPDQKIWIDITLLFGLTVVHKQYEFTLNTGLTDVGDKSMWTGPLPVQHEPPFYE